MRPLAILALIVPFAAPPQPANAQPTATPAVTAAQVDAIVAATFPSKDKIWQSRVEQDETQRQCSVTRNDPPPEMFEAIRARELATVRMPADGAVLGNWKKGEAIAQNGRGNQFSDAPGTVAGGNCYACHQMAPAEMSYGTMGPSLVAYGRDRGFAPDEARAAYAKIWNAQSVMPCSTMPRFGHNGVLDEQQVKDVTAFLFDPASPVNK